MILIYLKVKYKFEAIENNHNLNKALYLFPKSYKKKVGIIIIF